MLGRDQSILRRDGASVAAPNVTLGVRGQTTPDDLRQENSPGSIITGMISAIRCSPTSLGLPSGARCGAGRSECPKGSFDTDGSMR